MLKTDTYENQSKNDRNNSLNNKSVVIAGNGESLAHIDYSLLPDDFDVFRCNQFYFEDHYFLGKKIKAAFFNPSVFLEQYYTLNHLIKNNEYQCENVFLSSFSNLLIDSPQTHKLKQIFSNQVDASVYITQLKTFDLYLRFNELYNKKRITSGVYMCAVAIAMGYKTLYLTGIDFYTGDKTSYAFEHKTKNILELLPNFSRKVSQGDIHNPQTDIEALLFLQNNYDVKIYSISPSSPLSKYFPLPKIQNAYKRIPEKKENYTSDILIPPPFVYLKVRNKQAKENLYNNLIFKLFYDLFHLPNAIKNYLKEKKKFKTS